MVNSRYRVVTGGRNLDILIGKGDSDTWRATFADPDNDGIGRGYSAGEAAEDLLAGEVLPSVKKRFLRMIRADEAGR